MIHTKVEPQNRIYLRALKREGNFWEGTPYIENKKITILDKYKNLIISGNENKGIPDFLIGIKKFKKGLSIVAVQLI